MPTTPIYQLRYPLPTDPADVPVDLQELALDVEGKLGGPPVTSLPGAPVDGQIVRYRAAADGPIWTFQYQAAATAPHRWIYLGGASLTAIVGESHIYYPPTNWPNTSLVTLTNIALPLKGRWRFRGGLFGYAVAPGTVLYWTITTLPGAGPFTYTGAGANFAVYGSHGAQMGSFFSVLWDATIGTAPGQVRIAAAANGGTASPVGSPTWLEAIPVAVS